eukprot:CAMPEP_0204427566 /NCGR_PEP_ID=MMETSP0470-20130426/55518_1 /ASSEMBLY_ACC=CAM_ASM_000385 /TAXON_ID=2969 /ORGANISM="Oxyrrhis marina" /LENGTH=117 /DNA_ID=CAMNT_0051425381 /DNA_START=209 /DNA_END=562 /DNA_ORIENTATION=+
MTGPIVGDIEADALGRLSAVPWLGLPGRQPQGSSQSAVHKATHNAWGGGRVTENRQCHVGGCSPSYLRAGHGCGAGEAPLTICPGGWNPCCTITECGGRGAHLVGAGAQRATGWGPG